MQYITNRVAICYSFTFKKQMKHVFKIYNNGLAYLFWKQW